jgi:hypothetical protein
MRSTILIASVTFSAIVGSAGAKDLLVPNEYKTIQAAIDAASNGDTVVVSDGTYTGRTNFKGKAITVMSKNGPENCIIDCRGKNSNQSHGFIFREREDANSVIDGFTIEHGYRISGVGGVYGGGICCFRSSPTITNCIIRDNSASRGGGILCEYFSSPTITNCTIIANEAPDGLGGGICCFSWSSPTIIDCIISGNSGERGGGIYCQNESSPDIMNCIISGNFAYQGGGGLYCCYTSSPTITNCIISGNRARESGGALFCRNKASPKITNCTICDNKGRESGGGIVCWDSTPKVVNSILWGNSPNEIFLISGSPVVTYCDIKGGWESEGNIDTDPLFVMDGNDAITGTWTDEPTKSHKSNRATFVDRLANFAAGELVGQLICACADEKSWEHRRRQAIITANTATSVEVIFIVGGQESGGAEGAKYRLVDYYLRAGSACIDAGTFEDAPETDIEGNPRSGLKPDIGAFEAG